MLIIRKTQLDELQALAIRQFEDRTFEHLQRHAPGHCALLSKPQMLRVVHLGWQKAARHGLTGECCVRSFIDLMCLLGSHFDTDPLLPWAAEILADTDTQQVVRGDRLYDRAWQHIACLVPDYRDPAGQPTTARFVTELRQLRQLSDTAAADVARPQFSRALMARLERVFPAKFGCVGERRIAGLVDAGIVAAAGYGVRGERGLTLFVALMFVLGSSFAQDPLLPWAAAVLADPAVDDEPTRVDRLFADGIHFLNAWWSLSAVPQV